MKFRIIENRKQMDDWIDECRRHDMDFEFHFTGFPYLVFWEKTESNGYPDVVYDTLDTKECLNFYQQLEMIGNRS